MKKVIPCILCVVLLMQVLIITVFAAEITLDLSASSGYAKDDITISGVYTSNTWITVKALDSDNGAVFLKPIETDADGNYSTTFVVPEIDAGTLTIVAGVGSDVANMEFVVKQAVSGDDDEDTGGGDDTTGDDEDTKGEESTVSDENGNTITSTIEETENGYDITIGGDDFGQITGGSVKIVTQFVEITFDKTATAYISDTAGSGSIVLSIVNADTSALSNEAQELIGDRPAYEFKLTAGDSDLSTFGGGLAYVTIPYEPEDGEDVNRIVIYYITDDGELSVMTDSNYDGTSINAKFSTGHFSVYAVGYNEVSFDDVSEDSWYYNAVTFCAAREITTGTGDNLFSPNATLTRGQFLVMLMRAYGIEAEEDATDNFDDAGDTYYTGYLSAAKRLEITNGVGNNLYAPESKITRQDMFTLLYRALDVLGEWPEADTSATLSDFSDADAISDYAEQAMEAFVSSGIVSGSDGELDPLGNSTRAQMAQVLYNLLGL